MAASPRRISRLYPQLVTVKRPTPAAGSAGIEGETLSTIWTNEPADIQSRRGAYVQQEAGFFIQESFVGYFNPAAGVKAGDRIITSTETFVVVNASQKGTHAEASLDRLPQ